MSLLLGLCFLEVALGGCVVLELFSPGETVAANMQPAALVAQGALALIQVAACFLLCVVVVGLVLALFFTFALCFAAAFTVFVG